MKQFIIGIRRYEIEVTLGNTTVGGALSQERHSGKTQVISSRCARGEANSFSLCQSGSISTRKKLTHEDLWTELHSCSLGLLSYLCHVKFLLPFSLSLSFHLVFSVYLARLSIW